MPESVRDRLNCRHELIFLLVKQPAYWFDLDPIRIPRRPAPPTRPPGKPRDIHRGSTRPPKYGPHAREVTAGRRYDNLQRAGHRRAHPLGRNPGDVWAIPTRPYNGPHFAAYPIDLPLRCIAAGCRPGGTVLDPFTGTGTTGLAALQLERKFTGIELSPDFARLAAERLSGAARSERGPA
jgi:site-specific DNA-methyltransferase (cytosine-N4-specific)